MNSNDMKKIIEAVSKELEENYDKNKTEHYGIADRTLIPFATISSHSKVVRSEGTDEDNDVMICYDNEGWFIYDSTVQVGAGICKVVEERTYKISPKEVAKQFDKLQLFEKMSFIETCYKILFLSSYKSDLY